MRSWLKENGNFVIFDPRYLFFALIRTLAYFPVLVLGAYFPLLCLSFWDILSFSSVEHFEKCQKIVDVDRGFI